MLKKSGLLQLYKSDDDFTSLGGLDSLKAFCKRSLLQHGRDNPLKRPRGVLLLGVPGTGKSAFAKALGKETGRPTSDARHRGIDGKSCRTDRAERSACTANRGRDGSPAFLFIDEIEKALSGAAGSGKTIRACRLACWARCFSWMNDHTTNVYLIATCNDITRMPPELSRAERFDGIVFLDLPQRDAEGSHLGPVHRHV